MELVFDFNDISTNANVSVATSGPEKFSPHGSFVFTEAIVSNELRDWFVHVFDVTITSGIAYLGIVVNIVTIIIFYKQGYKETINISLTTIAVWDLIKCILGVIFRLHAPAKLVSEAFHLTYFAYVIFVGYADTFSTYASAVLAGYVAVERCLCVSLPFTVKFLLTPKVVTMVNVLLSVVVFGSFSILFSMHKIVYVYHQRLNATVGVYAYSEAYYRHPEMLAYFNVIGFLWPSVSLAVMCICTVIIAYHLRKASDFRSGNLGQSKTKGRQYKELSTRDRHVIKLLLVIIVIYMVNIVPRLGVALAKSIVPGFYLQQYHHNLFTVCIAVEFLFDFTNAAINPFIYYFMSSQYRDRFKELFCCSPQRNK